MKLWSRGLGKIELIIEPNTCIATKSLKAKGIAILGNIKEPVTWEFRVTLTPEDIPGLLRLTLSKSVLKFFFNNWRLKNVYCKNREPPIGRDEKLITKINDAYEQIVDG